VVVVVVVMYNLPIVFVDILDNDLMMMMLVD
jgi:hypothetical protein